jgi:hypothetical protein
MKIINNEIIEVIADEGKILTNGEIYAHHLWLSIFDSPSNWQEISEEEVPLNELFGENNQDFIE